MKKWTQIKRENRSVFTYLEGYCFKLFHPKMAPEHRGSTVKIKDNVKSKNEADGGNDKKEHGLRRKKKATEVAL